MADQLKNLLIGIFVVSALGIVIFMLLFLHPYLGDEGQILRVRFTDIDKVNVGTRVIFAGKAIGEVVRIHELEEIRQGRTERKGDIYVYELELGVDSSVKVYNTDRISLRTSGLLGEKSVSIDPEPLEPGQELRVVNDETLYAEEIGSVEDTFKEFKEVADKFDQALDSFTETLQELRDRRVWENIANTVENLSDITSSLAEQWGEVETSITNITDTTANAREVSEKIKDGEGAVGKLVAKDDLYLRATSLLSKGETILDDVNHYGVLFHLDKGWQRLRARRMNLLQKLKTPQEFRNFFNDEVNQISTSLSRVGMVLDKSENYPFLIEDREFQKVFSELMRRVEGLEEALKMYNIQLVQDEVKKTELSAER
ncbi:MAG: MlaD family protein [Waddliaceae bacterium]